MGVKTELKLEDIKPFLDVETLTPTLNGVRDTVYILDDKYVLKLFEEAIKDSLDEEVKLLSLCKDLPISKVVKEPFILKNKWAMIYKKCEGKSLDRATKNSIKQIAKFLKVFHSITKGDESKNINLFEKKLVQKLIDSTKIDKFQVIFDSLNIELKDDGIIHGDLFLDNCMFKDEKLSCVFDFNEACNGSFIFDLAVTSISFCKSDEEYNILLESYGCDIGLEEFKEYVKYALLYYSITRYIDSRDYKSLLNRIKDL